MARFLIEDSDISAEDNNLKATLWSQRLAKTSVKTKRTRYDTLIYSYTETWSANSMTCTGC